MFPEISLSKEKGSYTNYLRPNRLRKLFKITKLLILCIKNARPFKSALIKEKKTLLDGADLSGSAFAVRYAFYYSEHCTGLTGGLVNCKIVTSWARYDALDQPAHKNVSRPC